MPTSYTSLLNLALPVTGELSGTWGDTVNDYITKYVDSSVAGTQTISGTQTAVTLTRASGASLSPVGSGSTGSSQYAIINCTGNPAGTLTVTVDVSTGSPTLSNSTYSQTFAVINATSTNQSVVVRATTTSGTSTGVTMVSGERALIAWSGSDFTKIATSVADGVTTFSAGTTGFTPSTATSGAVTLAGTLATTNGGTGLTSFTSGGAVYATSTSALTTGTLPTTAGGTGLTSFTANGVVYASSTSALTTGSALQFDGTNLGLGVTPNSGWDTATPALQIKERLSLAGYLGSSWVTHNAYNASTGWRYLTSNPASQIRFADNQILFNIAPSGTAGNTISFTQAMTLSAAGGLSIGTTTDAGAGNIRVNGGALIGDGTAAAPTFTFYNESNVGIFRAGAGVLGFSTAGTERARITSGGQFAVVGAGTAGAPVISKSDDLDTGIFFPAANELAFAVNGVEELRITSAGFTQPVAYADTVVAIGNTGTAKTIDLQTANVFTATLTGNCTFTLSNPIATGSSSFTLILTNDGTAGRTVAWAGGSFKFPGGAASLSRTTTANAVDIWVFFTPDGGTTWYGNIAMKNMTA